MIFFPVTPEQQERKIIAFMLWMIFGVIIFFSNWCTGWRFSISSYVLPLSMDRFRLIRKRSMTSLGVTQFYPVKRVLLQTNLIKNRSPYLYRTMKIVRRSDFNQIGFRQDNHRRTCLRRLNIYGLLCIILRNNVVYHDPRIYCRSNRISPIRTSLPVWGNIRR